MSGPCLDLWDPDRVCIAISRDLGDAVTYQPLRALVLLAAMALAITACGTSHPPTAGQTRGVVSTPTPSTLPSSQVSDLEAGLESADPQSVENVLADELKSVYQSDPEALLPPGSKIVISPDTMLVHGSLASVLATVTGTEPGTYRLLMVRGPSGWLVYGTSRA
jgi:hypothetical protein